MVTAYLHAQADTTSNPQLYHVKNAAQYVLLVIIMAIA